VAIYRAHKASPIVIASEGEERFSAALQVLTVPVTHPKLAFVLGTVVGHLFGYEAALAIDAQAHPLREARAVLDDLVLSRIDGDDLLAAMPPLFEPIAHRWANGLRSGSYDGHLEASTGSRISTLLRYASGVLPLDVYQVDFGRQGTPTVLLEDLTAALGNGIEELTRPVDAIKHQAKTVTVGISRSDEGVLQIPLVAAVVQAGAPRDRLSYRALRTIANLDPAVEEVTGFTRYRIEGRLDTNDATIVVVDRGGISLDLPLRTEVNPLLRGTKHRAAFEREVTVAVGRSDGRSVLLVPEVKGNQCTGITLLHVRFHEHLPVPVMRSVLEGYRHRYEALRDVVTETEPVMRDDLLGTLSVVELLTAPVFVLAAAWKPTD
jgi:glucosamine--fructose-6-phosphate aminotransferase (isomerizing)